MNNKTEEVDITPENIAPEDITPKPLDEPNYKDLYIRSLADYENMKKFMENRNLHSKRDAYAEILKDVIAPVYNDLCRGVSNDINGCENILMNLINSIRKFNIDVYDIDLIGQKFDDSIMNAVMIEKTENEEYDGNVFSVLEPAFIDLETGKTLIYAKVVVFKYNVD